MKNRTLFVLFWLLALFIVLASSFLIYSKGNAMAPTMLEKMANLLIEDEEGVNISLKGGDVTFVAPQDLVDWWNLNKEALLPWQITKNYTARVVNMFNDGFESGDTSAWDDVVSVPTINAGSALEGSFGMENTAPGAFVVEEWTSLNDQTLNIIFKLDLNDYDANDAAYNSIVEVRDDTTTIAYLNLIYRDADSSWFLKLLIYDDDNEVQFGREYKVHLATEYDIKLQFRFMKNGGATLWVDGVKKRGITKVDCATRKPDEIRFGRGSSVGVGWSGSYYTDSFSTISIAEYYNNTGYVFAWEHLATGRYQLTPTPDLPHNVVINATAIGLDGEYVTVESSSTTAIVIEHFDKAAALTDGAFFLDVKIWE